VFFAKKGKKKIGGTSARVKEKMKTKESRKGADKRKQTTVHLPRKKKKKKKKV